MRFIFISRLPNREKETGLRPSSLHWKSKEITLTEEQITALLDNKSVMAPAKDIPNISLKTCKKCPDHIDPGIAF